MRFEKSRFCKVYIDVFQKKRLFFVFEGEQYYVLFKVFFLFFIAVIQVSPCCVL